MFKLDDLSVSYILLFSFSIAVLLLIFNIFYLSQKIYRTSINFSNYSKKRKYFNQKSNFTIPKYHVGVILMLGASTVFVVLNNYLSNYIYGTLILLVSSVFLLFISVSTEKKITSLEDFDKFYDLIQNIFLNEKKLLEENQHQFNSITELNKKLNEIIEHFKKYFTTLEVNDAINKIISKIQQNKNFITKEANKLTKTFDETLYNYIIDNNIENVKFGNPFANFSHHEIDLEIENFSLNFKNVISRELSDKLSDPQLHLTTISLIINQMKTFDLIIYEDSVYKMLDHFDNEYVENKIKILKLLIQFDILSQNKLIDYIISSHKYGLIYGDLINTLKGQQHFNYLYELAKNNNDELLTKWMDKIDSKHVALIKSLIAKLSGENISADIFTQFIELNSITSGFHQNHNIIEHKLVSILNYYELNPLSKKIQQNIINDLKTYSNQTIQQDKIHLIEKLYTDIQEEMSFKLNRVSHIVKYILRNYSRFGTYISKQSLIKEFQIYRFTLDVSNLDTLFYVLLSVMKKSSSNNDIDFMNTLYLESDEKKALADYQVQNSNSVLLNAINNQLINKFSIYSIISKIENKRLLVDMLMS